MTDLSIARHETSADQPLFYTAHQPLVETSRGAEIAIQQLHKYYGKVCVLDHLNLNIAAGEFVAIVGRSGCGKSTLLRLIAGLEASTQGEIQIQNTQAQLVQTQEIRVMFQDPRLLPWKNILANVQLGLQKQQFSQAAQLLEKVGLKDKASLWPSQLSGGQRQRTALARALSHQPRILLLDEPLGALDALTRLEMQNLIETLWREQGFTAILVTHDVSEAVQLADRIILLDQGHIAQQFQVDLPRPRQKGAHFAELEQQVLAAVLAT
ncbi:ABC transporter ATP-binding protein [Acinetobacter sp. MD2(2019)]|uniref:ABC transporter ATP-binding protein n=1 Tax=Acinetobacter sp. MD2(2019) TaxID=2605273 RepID=UPI002D1F407D|nr:ATP-binding cassette domain-containing protein [Acinetobacter sp. MD2(2019)]MEB3753525.1 ATP-binding cassette domain-containing protein [Acinetobacter sp. MD2(2019)]